MTNPQGAVAKQPSVIGLLQKYRAQIEAALPTHMDPDRMVRIVTTEIYRNPELQNCDPISFMGAVVQASQLGLEPGLQGHAYLIPYWNKKKGVREVQFQPGYKGLMDLAYRSGKVKFIDAHAVYEKDEFSFQYGTNPFLKHVPAEGDRGELTHFYAVAVLENGGSIFKVMTKDDVDKIKSKSQAADSKFSPWNDPVVGYIEMGKKTPIIRVCKYLPSSPEDRELGIAVASAERADAGIAQDNQALLGEVAKLLDERPPVPVPDADGPETTADGETDESGGDGPGDEKPAGTRGKARDTLKAKRQEQVDETTGEVTEAEPEPEGESDPGNQEQMSFDE